jgi:rRNA-processing protein FCF1
MRFLIDTSAILQSPEILARAKNQHLLIPRAVLSELFAPGKQAFRPQFGPLVTEALTAGVEIIEGPALLKKELLASDPYAQRLSNTDIEIMRTAVDITERIGSNSVSVITLDKALKQALESRRINSLTPSEFLFQQAGTTPDVKTLNSATSVSRSQQRYMLYSAIAGALISAVGHFTYNNLSYLTSTVSVWGTVITLMLIGIGLFWYRQHFRLSYGVAEFIVGVMMASYPFFPDFNYSALDVVQSIQILGGLYVMVRGLDNVGKGLEGTRLQGLWDRWFA